MDGSNRPATAVRRRPVANPYLKKKAPIGGVRAARPSVASPAAKALAPAVRTPAAATVTPKLARAESHRRSDAAAGQRLTVTPTPRKRDRSTGGDGAARARPAKVAKAPPATGKSTTTANRADQRRGQSYQRVTGRGSSSESERSGRAPTSAGVPAPVQPLPSRRGPATLKTKLKSEIAQLHRRKREFLQQKEAEKRRELKQKELERQRVLKEREARRRAALREEERRRRDEEARRAVVGRCLDGMARGVEKRMELERRTGAHFAVAEAMEGIVGKIEKEERERRRKAREDRKREEERRLREAAARFSATTSMGGLAARANTHGTALPEGWLRRKEVESCLSGLVAAVENAASLEARGVTASILGLRRPQFMEFLAASTFDLMQSGRPVGDVMKQHAMQQHPRMQSTMHPQMQSMMHPQIQSMMQPQMQPMMQKAKHQTMQPMMQQTIPFAHDPRGMAEATCTGWQARPHASMNASPSTVSARSFGVLFPQAPSAKTPPVTTSVLHRAPLADRYSPHSKSHFALPSEIRLSKRTAGDSFGVTLRLECKSALVPRDEVITDGAAPAGSAPGAVVKEDVPAKTRKPRRKRVEYAVMAVVNADRATFDGADRLLPGDIVLSVNGRTVGGMTFAQACRAIGETSVCSVTGVVRCTLGVARMHRSSKHNALAVANKLPGNPLPAMPVSVGMKGDPIGAKAPAVPAAPLKPLPHELSSAEWAALVRGLSTMPHRLFSGVALMTVSRRQIIEATLKSDEICGGTTLARRGVQALEFRLASESARIASMMEERAFLHWAREGIVEAMWSGLHGIDDGPPIHDPMTDAKRHELRWLPRPAVGCRCGSQSHEFVHDARCVLYKDIMRYCDERSIPVRSGGDAAKGKGPSVKRKPKNAMERACIASFERLRTESIETREEGEFVFEMERIQCSKMGKAAFAPKLLSVLVLSAVASLTDSVREKWPEVSEDGYCGEAECRKEVKPQLSSVTLPNHTPSRIAGESTATEPPSDSESDNDDDDDDVPLSALLQKENEPRDVETEPRPLPPQCLGQKFKDIPKKMVAPNPYFLAEILKRISKTHGHLFQEPGHSEYAWQQRHRSSLTAPLPREVMFAGNPREPGSLSFENVRFVLDDDRMSRLGHAWKNRTGAISSDRWLVAHLSSDAVTGLCHEVNVLTGLGILAVTESGRLTLARGWERRVPRAVLLEMEHKWGSRVDEYNLHCIHDVIRSTLEGQWQSVKGEWRLATKKGSDDASGGDEVVFEEEEYLMRERIFAENYLSWANEKSGVGEFGV